MPFTLRTIWREGPVVGSRYVRYDNTGTLINVDRFKNYRNYYWIGVTLVGSGDLPSYNTAGLPEYTVIEADGTSGWATANYWRHVTELQKSALDSYVQAERPIIEFNKNLEGELQESKTIFGQLPKFNHYRRQGDLLYPFNDGGEENLNDEYAQNHLLVDLGVEDYVALAISDDPNLTAKTFTYAGRTYLQGLVNGAFVPEQDGVEYGYKVDVVEVPGDRGSISGVTFDSTVIPQIITLTYNADDDVLEVFSSVDGALADAVFGTAYTTATGLEFTPVTGSDPSIDGDRFTLVVKSYVYVQHNLYVSLDGSPRTLANPEDIINEDESLVVVNAVPSSANGVWEVPPQLMWNVQNETRSEIGQGDLYSHFTSIIQAQTDLEGTSTGSNNWRLLTPDVGLGGSIKQYDGEVSLLLSNLLQEGLSFPTLIDFARDSYQNLQVNIRLFIEDELPNLIVDGSYNPSTSEIVTDELVELFKTYLARSSSVVTASATTVDDHLATTFYDTTSSLENLVVTLPYLGLADPVEPARELDLELNMEMIVHHDGHKTGIPTISQDVLKRLVQKTFMRSSGQETAGSVTGFTAPIKPYRGQFWFKTATNELFFYDVTSDVGELSDSAQEGDYSYDRQSDSVWEYSVGSWTLLGNTSTEVNLPWRVLDLSEAITDLTLAIETELYELCPPLAARFDSSPLLLSDQYVPLMEQELKLFGVRYGVPDVYGAVYDPDNPFTWNYQTGLGVGVWHEHYREQYGTSRPDLQPWIPAGYVDEAAMLADLIGNSLLPGGTTEWDISYWNACATFLRAKYVLNGKPSNLSLIVSTGALIAPYDATSAEAFINDPPPDANASFAYGHLGPVELLWRRSGEYLYAQQKTFFRIDPLTYVNSTWGIKNAVAGGYTFNLQQGHKSSVADLQLHGEVLPEALAADQLSVTVTVDPVFEVVYELVCVSRLDDIFMITGGEITSPEFITDSTWSGSYIDLELSHLLRGFFWGDRFTVTVSPEGEVDVVVSSQSYLRAEGFCQLYVQYLRNFGQDTDVSLNRTLFNDWEVKLGYRFDTLINTDLLKVKAPDETISTSAYQVLIKENKFTSSTWLNAVRVTVARRGSSQRIGSYLVPSGAEPGSDWVFRVDNYNPQRPLLAWNLYNLSGAYTTFTALDGSATSHPWKHYSETTGVSRVAAPFLITGLQNVVNFIFGLSEKLYSDGWRFNDQNDPIVDPETGRMVDYQLLVEKFLVLMYSGANNNTSFLFNPFSRKVWFETERGVVSNLNSYFGMEQETVPKLLTSEQHQLDRDKVRVFRQDELTEFVFDEPVYTFHLLTSEYEHVVLFENYAAEVLFYDSFLGLVIPNVFFEGRRQDSPTGRLDFGGHFLLGGEMKRNLESSVGGISKLYETASTISALPEVARARAALGFKHKNYFDLRETSEQAEFRFWQGMIGHKGTNFSVNAFINSAKYRTASLDEYWAYKLATYGDARIGSAPELKVRLEDVVDRQRTPYLFYEVSETPEIAGDVISDEGFDTTPYDSSTYDFATIYLPEVTAGMEFIDPSQAIIISPTDETRWYSYGDLTTLQYVELVLLLEKTIVIGDLDEVIRVTDAAGNPVRADCFELVDVATDIVYYERGNLIVGSDPVEYEDATFIRVNHSTIRILSEDLVGLTMKVRAYGPPLAAYSPSQLYDYLRNVMVKDDFTWWDPARGIYAPLAIAQVDYQDVIDPATYNTGLITKRIARQKPWARGELGKIWWNRAGLDYQPYSDTKIYSNMSDRLNRWGALAEYSTIEAYEWVASDVPPDEYEGDLGVDKLVTRTRTWQQRPIAWRYSANPEVTDRAFLAYQPARLEVADGKITIAEGSLEDAGLTLGARVAGAIYSGMMKIDPELTTIFGTAEVTSASRTVIGSESESAFTLSGGAVFLTDQHFTFDVEVDEGVISYREDYFGQYSLTYEIESTVYYLSLKHVPTGTFQRLIVHDTPVQAGSRDTYFFDELGLRVSYVPVYGHNESWTGFGSTVAEDRIQLLSLALGNPGHEIYVRSQADALILIPFSPDGIIELSILDPDATLQGWVSWIDPSTNPLYSARPPHNLYEPFAGDWVSVDTRLLEVSTDLQSKLSDPWIWFDDSSYVPYRSSWSTWTAVEAEKRQVQYDNLATDYATFFADNFTFSLSATDLAARVRVYHNGVRVPSRYKIIEVDESTSIARVDVDLLALGHLITVIVDPVELSAAELSFDPEVDGDPLVVAQYKRHRPYTVEERRDEYNGRTLKTYYFWAKNKETPGVNKQAAVKQVADLLYHPRDSFCVPQILKYYDQVDGRPNRYALISVEELGRYVRQANAYKMRFKSKPHLRDTDNDLDLKNVHEEWILIRPYQGHRIPQRLWEVATDTVAGVNQVGEELPNASLTLYDEHTGSSDRYGAERGQVLTDALAARAVVKFTLLNTRVNKYVNQELVPDYVTFDGFDIDNLDELLSTPESSRQLMTDLWRLAKPKQINEIFFALLEDGMAKNTEMPNFFKTSFIAVNDIRTVTFPSGSLASNVDVTFA